MVVLLVASSASAAKQPPVVALHVTVNGSGTVWVPGHPPFTCYASFPTSSHCRRTFYARKGRRFVIKESPASGWKLWRWTGACHGSAASCSLRVNAKQFGFVTASFVPPGDRLNPYRLGTTATLTDGWQLKVNSVILNADSQVEAVDSQSPPPAGAQYTLVNVSMTYAGSDTSVPALPLSGVLAVGAGNAGYDVDGLCIPPPLDLGSDFTQVSSGQSVTGNLCFEIASHDAATLMLTAHGTTGLAVWFRLR
jgi:hypothetical protein